jgi:hypothetical protein
MKPLIKFVFLELSNHCEILPGVILSFKELNTFCDYCGNPIKYVAQKKQRSMSARANAKNLIS